ncbi:conserved hypothetical protein [Desulfosarcina cetonica]|uniref:YceH family protein n=1 Tax=Desulfosarcina cetonica TaxID=90730 RepID=UPI0006D103A4|nr:YceH family protein [Desulfosarcina cetonica]VTR69355.1 conserved hypothetical protein [Desulfosarcina cetonica]
MGTQLSQQEIRVLGCLMEKAMATPEYYPLSLNALTNACNQKSNREPVVAWDEQTVEEAVADLEAKGWVNRSTVGRVPKFEERFTHQHNMVASEAAVLCVLLLRGPQTPGAIRGRTERLHAFDSLEALQETLDRLVEWGHVHRLPRLPGHKEVRFMHLLAGESDAGAAEAVASDVLPAAAGTDRLAQLEARVDALNSELADLKAMFDSFRQQFE